MAADRGSVSVTLGSPGAVLTSVDGGAPDEPDLDMLDRFAERALAAGGDPAGGLTLADQVAAEVPLPGSGGTLQLWSVLATLGAADLTVARAVEPHLDALAILAEARRDTAADLDALPGGVWGVFAAEGPGARLEAHGQDGSILLDGVKPWCSLATQVDAALITAWDGPARRLYAVDMSHPGVAPGPTDGWVARGLAAVPSPPVTFEQVPAIPVGDPGWYLDRPGFAWGGIGVAAVWFGAVVAVARRLLPSAGGREPDQVALMHVGESEIDLQGARAVLGQTARLVDDAATSVRPPDQATRRLWAYAARGSVARCAERVLTRVGRATGPGPLVFDEGHARRVADLTVYVRQEHAERDAAALGALLTSGTRQAAASRTGNGSGNRT